MTSGGKVGGNKLYFGDNLDILREYVADESVDLVYLDPPFNSRAQYNVLFQSPADDAASAQVEAFRDTWTWGDEAERSYSEIMKLGGGAARFVDALRSALKESDMMAYLVMMGVRLHELHKKLKPTGSLYLHCDPTASHYLKVILDGVFGPSLFVNEIVWKRSDAKGDSGQGAKHFGRVNDSILFFSKTEDRTWNPQFGPLDPGYVERFYRHEDEDGRRYKLDNMLGPGGAAKGNPKYEVMGVERYWRYSQKRMSELIAQGRVIQTNPGTVPMYKRYLDESKGTPLTTNWTDISLLRGWSSEKIGYPTQKPVALLDRIVRASSNKGDVVLDPFCGCGTTIEASERVGRRWIGVDIAVHAIKVIEARLSDRLGSGIQYQSEGMPRDFESAIRLAARDKYQFQWWANYLFNPHALREQKKGADRGIDGEIFFPNGPGRPWGRMLTSVKGGEQVGPSMVRDFARVLDREHANLGLFICLHSPTKEMRREAASVGRADVVHGDIPKLQIVPIEDWFKGKMPLLPPLEHLPSAAFAGKRRVSPTAARPDAEQPELPFSFVGGKADKSVTRHLNPKMVVSDARESA